MKGLWLTGLLLLLLGPPARAEEVTLSAALAEAVAQRPFVRAAAADAAALQAARDEARSVLLPRLSASERFVRTNEPGSSLFISLNQQDLVLGPAEIYNDPATRQDFETRLQVDQVLFDAARWQGWRSAEARAEAGAAAARWSREQAAFAAFQAYLEVQLAGLARASAASSVAEGEELVRTARLQQEAGLALKADTLRARIFLAESEQRLLTAENDQRLARRQLALALGRSEGEVDIAAPLRLADLPEPAGPPAAPRPDLEGLAQLTRAARHEQALARSGYLPTVGVSASYTGHDPEGPGFDADSWMVAGQLQWTLFDGFAREAAVARTRAATTASTARHQEAERQAALEREQTVLRTTETRRQWETAQQNLHLAEESRRLLAERYAAGLADLTELLAVQATLEQARATAAAAEARHLLGLGRQQLVQGTFIATFLPNEEPLP